MKKGTLTQTVGRSLRGAQESIPVRYEQDPAVGERFICFGKSLTPPIEIPDQGAIAIATRVISTSPVTVLTRRMAGFIFTTESGSVYRLERND